MPKAGELQKKWYLVDAKGKTLGRLAARVAMILRGKHKPTYAPHLDTGDAVVIVNADGIEVTGAKRQKKAYHRHTGYPGGLKTETFENLHSRQPERVLELAIKGMLPRGPLGREMFRKLKVYAGQSHPHVAQQPENIEV